MVTWVDSVAAKLSLNPNEVAVHIETTIRSNRDAVADVIAEALYHPDLLDVNWANTLDAKNREANQAANYFRAPALSLHFDYTHWRNVRPR